MRLHSIILCACLFVATFSYCQNSFNTNQNYNADKSIADANLISINPAMALSHPQSLANTWFEKPLPLNHYSECEKNVQILINKSSAEQVTTSQMSDNRSEWTEIDFEPITPYTWKWVDFELVNDDGTCSTAQLRRPNWWIKKTKSDKIGNKVYLDLPQMGMEGMATVTGIRVNQLDSRLLNGQHHDGFVDRPITGMFTHQSENVYRIYFDGREESVGITGNHPLWSSDRNGWVAAREFKPGEHVKTYSGISKIKSIEKQTGSVTVYNLEVYRDHNYHASSTSVLAHNECWNMLWDKVMDEWKYLTRATGEPHGWVVGRTTGTTRRTLLHYEQAHTRGTAPWRVKNNGIYNAIALEENIAISEGSQQIIIKIMMPDEGYAFDNMLASDVLKAAGYEVRISREVNKNWVEGTKDISHMVNDIAPPANDGSITIPARRK